ncbi:hypothetical protein SpCBS45565_g07584 [Spizellomyces sp. 'palustris']|nr:hypothetical protein SpCBS45565_g07584 [Spizellomyces sp. 'palustris']
MIREALHRYITQPIAALLEPYIRMGYEGLTSNKTQRFALNTAIFGVVFGGLLGMALAIYGLFYWIYIPQVAHVIPVYMQYGGPGEKMQPSAYVDFTGANSRQQSAYLTPDQHYDLALELVVPDSNNNFELGNFMIYIDLQTKDNRTTASSSRSATLEYRTPLLKTMLTVVKGVPLVLGLTSEAQTVKVLLLEKYEESEAYPIHHALIRLSDNRLQLYQTKLHVDANFQGLRFFMYHWRATTAAVFVSVFMFWETVFAFTLWRLFLSLFKQRADTASGEEIDLNGTSEKLGADMEDVERFSADKASDEDDRISVPRSVVGQATHLPSSPRSMSSAPSYHSGAVPMGSPPQYAASPPGFEDRGRTSPIRLHTGSPYSSAYSYAFPFSSAGGLNGPAGAGMLPFTGYTSVSALRAAAVTAATSAPSGVYTAPPPAHYIPQPSPSIQPQRAATPSTTTEDVAQNTLLNPVLLSPELQTLAALRDANPGMRESYPPGLRFRRRTPDGRYETIEKIGDVDPEDIIRGVIVRVEDMEIEQTVPIISAAAEGGEGRSNSGVVPVGDELGRAEDEMVPTDLPREWCVVSDEDKDV